MSAGYYLFSFLCFISLFSVHVQTSVNVQTVFGVTASDLA